MPPTVVTFYSFKGGVGRTQTLANMAVGLANRGRKVVAVDMDLESPGPHTYFYAIGAKAPLADGDLADRDGLLEHLERCQALPSEVPRIDDLLLEVTHPIHRPGAGWIRLLPAGRLVGDYPERVAGFSWERFYEESHGSQYLDLFRDQLLATGADFVLLDSRTGMTDVATICTFQLPDIVIILFALHQQVSTAPPVWLVQFRALATKARKRCARGVYCLFRRASMSRASSLCGMSGSCARGSACRGWGSFS